VKVFEIAALAACSETLPRGERGWGRGNAIRQESCGVQRSEDTVISNGIARGEGRAVTLTRSSGVRSRPNTKEPGFLWYPRASACLDRGCLLASSFMETRARSPLSGHCYTMPCRAARRSPFWNGAFLGHTGQLSRQTPVLSSLLRRGARHFRYSILIDL